VVIVIDDGIATGDGAGRTAGDPQPQAEELVLAVPVAPGDTVENLRPEVDALICLETPWMFQASAISIATSVSDQEVVAHSESLSSQATVDVKRIPGARWRSDLALKIRSR
jgi:predicted phosphoribosyltransferase